MQERSYALTRRWVGAVPDALEQSDPETFAEFISDHPQPARSELLGRPLGRRLDLEQQRVALAAAGADRREPQAAAVPPQLVDHRPENPRP